MLCRRVKISLTLPTFNFCYWASFARLNGAELNCKHLSVDLAMQVSYVHCGSFWSIVVCYIAFFCLQCLNAGSTTLYSNKFIVLTDAFSALNCLQCFNTIGWAVRKSIQPVKKLSDEVLVWLSVWINVQMICIVQLMPLPPHHLVLC